MAIIQVELKEELYSALSSYNTSSAYEGDTNALKLLQKYGGVRFKRVRSQAASCGLKNMNERTVDTNYIQLHMDVWAHLVDSLVADFDTEENAQIIMPFLIPMSFLDTSAFSLTTLISDDARGGIEYGVSFVPNFTTMFYQLGTTGLREGLWGNDDSSASVALTRGSSNSLVASLATNYNSKEFNFRLFDSTFAQQQASVAATVSSGSLTYSCTPAAGSYTSGFVFLDSMQYAAASDSTAFRTSVNVAYIPGFVSSWAIGYKA